MARAAGMSSARRTARSGVGSAGSRASLEREELVATKISIPSIRPAHLPRSRLLEALDQATTRTLTLVCTPAGFGKTTLLASWAAGANRRVAWLSLDPADNDPVRFWRYVAGALHRAGAPIGERLVSLLDGPGGISGRGVVAVLINELDAIADDVTVVLDDYHVIEPRSIHDGVASLLERCPSRVNVVITARTDPPLPLARLRAGDQLAELRAADLRFTPEESAAFLRDVWGLDLLSEGVAVLRERTEGWAVGLQLAALSLKERSDASAFLDAFSGSHRYVLDYLSSEVLEHQPDAVRTFLLQTSLLERLSGSLCDAVTGRADGHAMLEELERANLFLVPLDDERRWYRFHHLFRDLLVARLGRDDPRRVPELHARAAAWCEAHGLVDEAVHHALASPDTAEATRIVKEHLAETIHRGETVIVERWISALPSDAVRAEPELCLTEALTQLHRGRLDAAERRLEHAERASETWSGSSNLEVPTDGGMVAEIPAAIALLRAELAVARGDPEGASRSARSALGHLAPEERTPRFSARWLVAFAEWIRGHMDDAEAAFTEVLNEGRSLPDTFTAMSPFFALGRVQEARGRLGAALRTYRDALRQVTEDARLSTIRHAAEAHIGMARVLYQRNQVVDALQHVTAGLEYGRPVLDIATPIAGLVALGWIRHALGEDVSALDAMDEAFHLRSDPQIVSLVNPAPTERARLLLLLGRTDDAASWIDELGLSEMDELTYPREREHLVLARLLLARGDAAGALDLLERLRALAEAQDRVESLISIRALEALALQAAGEQGNALRALAHAVSLAEPEGSIRAFVDEGPRMAALIRSLVGARQRGRSPAVPARVRQHLTRIVQASGVERSRDRAPGPTTAMADPLTDRELEILRLMAAGRRNAEIARDLVVTLETVKKHGTHIFDKLGARNRTEAVALGRELGLLR